MHISARRGARWRGARRRRTRRRRSPISGKRPRIRIAGRPVRDPPERHARTSNGRVATSRIIIASTGSGAHRASVRPALAARSRGTFTNHGSADGRRGDRPRGRRGSGWPRDATISALLAMNSSTWQVSAGGERYVLKIAAPTDARGRRGRRVARRSPGSEPAHRCGTSVFAAIESSPCSSSWRVVSWGASTATRDLVGENAGTGSRAAPRRSRPGGPRPLAVALARARRRSTEPDLRQAAVDAIEAAERIAPDRDPRDPPWRPGARRRSSLLGSGRGDDRLGRGVSTGRCCTTWRRPWL